MKPELSATMVACIDDAQAAGGELIRFAGGYWAKRGAAIQSHNGAPVGAHGTSTVNAIVTRGYAEYSEHRDGRNGPFPIALKLTAKASA